MTSDSYPIEKLPRDRFPSLLCEIPDAPTHIYVRGALPPLGHKLLCVVGSRTYSTYGKEVVRKLIGDLRGQPISIVSGLALGIDALAHEAALQAGLHTIAIPGSGIDDRVIYPKTNAALAARILRAGGLLLSEFEPTFEATHWSFPARNRIMAGLSHATLIIEARPKSGTLITARHALDYNRDVITVPGSIFSEHSSGPHMLIDDGARPITSADDILDVLSIPATHTPSVIANTLSETERKILVLLDAPRSTDELLRLMHTPVHETHTALSLLELRGYIRESNGSILRLVSLS